QVKSPEGARSMGNAGDFAPSGLKPGRVSSAPRGCAPGYPIPPLRGSRPGFATKQFLARSWHLLFRLLRPPLNGVAIRDGPSSNAWFCQPWPSAVAAERTDVQAGTARLLQATFKSSIIFTATPLAEAGFCPVTRFPSATLNACQGAALWKIAPCFVSAVSNSNGTSAFA